MSNKTSIEGLSALLHTLMLPLAALNATSMKSLWRCLTWSVIR
ncbi:Uncharacterised protein [Vibrio cholerae]|nr:Uncharacterised protein [Vibrio cholerae]